RHERGRSRGLVRAAPAELRTRTDRRAGIRAPGRGRDAPRMIGSLLLIGLLLGMKHAVEADHVAAVASLATRSRRLRATVTLAAMWGIGDARMLVIVGVVVIALRIALPEPLPEVFE